MFRFWQGMVWLLVLLGVTAGNLWGASNGRILRFSDTPRLPQTSVQGASLDRLAPVSAPSVPVAPARDWLKRNGWKRLWPLLWIGKDPGLAFAGPAARRYLRIDADETFYIWGRRFDLDPYRFPDLEITWGIEQFPEQAAFDLPGRNDRALVITIALGPKVPSPGLMPDVPRSLAFFWGEEETVGTSYTCITPRQGPQHVRLQCTYPHIKFIALRRGGAGGVYTDRVNILETFQRYFPAYWKQYQRVPPIVGISFEARSDQTNSATRARLYAIAFTPPGSHNGHLPTSESEGP